MTIEANKELARNFIDALNRADSVRDGQVIELKEYLDTLHASEVFLGG